MPGQSNGWRRHWLSNKWMPFHGNLQKKKKMWKVSGWVSVACFSWNRKWWINWNGNLNYAVIIVIIIWVIKLEVNHSRQHHNGTDWNAMNTTASQVHLAEFYTPQRTKRRVIKRKNAKIKKDQAQRLECHPRRRRRWSSDNAHVHHRNQQLKFHFEFSFYVFAPSYTASLQWPHDASTKPNNLQIRYNWCNKHLWFIKYQCASHDATDAEKHDNWQIEKNEKSYDFTQTAHLTCVLRHRKQSNKMIDLINNLSTMRLMPSNTFCGLPKEERVSSLIYGRCGWRCLLVCLSWCVWCILNILR